MAKVITLSRKFPPYHPKAGQPTYFVEQVLNALGIDFRREKYFKLLLVLNEKKITEGKLKTDEIYRWWNHLNHSLQLEISGKEKLHTIRAGSRWKQGDKASLRVWSGKPYNSPQIIIAPDVELVKVYDFIVTEYHGSVWIESETKAHVIPPDSVNDSYKTISRLAKNDGLNTQDLLDWFKYPKEFDGQILCWKGVDYV